MIRPLAPLGFAALVFASTLPAQKPVAVEASMKKADLMNRESPPPVMPPSEDVAMTRTAISGLTLPEGFTDAWFGSCTIASKPIAIVMGKSSADAKDDDTLFVDRNGNGKLDDDEKLDMQVRSMSRGDNHFSQAIPVETTLDLGASPLPVVFTFRQMNDADPDASLMFLDYLEAPVHVGDDECLVAIVDENHDGKFNGADDMWALVKPDDRRPASAYGMMKLDEHGFFNGNLIGIQVTDDNKVEITTAAASGPNPADLAAQRARVEKIWTERFDKEREDFVKQRKLDESRPKATDPIHWNYVSFDAAKKLAAEAGKPLFVDVMAFWCVWCYRMDYYTYPDKEVAQLLNEKFVPVKIIQEQAAEGDYKALMDAMEARGIPAMGIFDADGNVLHKISGWNSPVDFVKELEAGLKAAAK